MFYAQPVKAKEEAYIYTDLGKAEAVAGGKLQLWACINLCSPLFYRDPVAHAWPERERITAPTCPRCRRRLRRKSRRIWDGHVKLMRPPR